MNKTINTFLLPGDLKTWKLEKLWAWKTFKTGQKTEDSRYIYKTELDKACFQHAMAHEDFEH